ncbi:MAG TPA: MFS transporter [Vicinamibacterales bacterium]|nr:MFS transporter [Vicinamibacterales bacterium]
MPTRLFTPRFFLMFGYSFTVFVSLFQLLPAAPYRILDLGGSTAVAGLFLGLLTYSSALSAPLTGSLSDRLGHRRVLIGVSFLLAGFTASYAFIGNYKVMLVVVFVHGFIWSGLLAASSAYMTAIIPESRRAEGLSYWGLASVLALGAAPAIGFWVYKHGWFTLCAELTALNLTMGVIALQLPDDHATPATDAQNPANPGSGKGVEWRVLALSIGLAMISFGYGSLTSFSALFADDLGIAPRSVFLIAMAIAILVSRLTIGRIVDRLGHRYVLTRAIIAPPIGLLILAFAFGKISFLVAALVFGAGFGLMHPAYSAYMMKHVAPSRRGAAFGAMLAAFDTGIGTGSSLMGWVIHVYGFRAGFACAAIVAGIALPYFLVAEKKLGFE